MRGVGPLQSGPVTASHLPKTSERPRSPFRLGELEVRPASGEIVGPAGTQRLRPLLMEILLRLASEPGEVVRRETLLEQAWERRMVNDEVLSRAIAELRTALGDDARAARYIETLPKIGYRLVAPVAPLEPVVAPPTPAAAPAPARRSVLHLGLAAGGVIALAALAFFALRGAPRDDLVAKLAAARTFTSDPVLEVGPRFSPDGLHVAFALGEGPTSKLVIQSTQDASRRVVGDGTDLRVNPVFFPDGKRIAYWRRAAGTCAIVELELASGAERPLLDCALLPRARFDLSRDGRRIVFAGQAHPQKPAGLWLADVGGGPPGPLTEPEPGMGEDGMPRFSPDGRRVAFFRGNDSHRRLWIAELDGSRSLRQVSRADGLSYGIAWMGASGPLLVAADWAGFRALNVLDAQTGDFRMVGARGARFPDVGPRGEVVWENAVYSANLWRVAPGAEPQPLWKSTRYTSQAEFSPDGAHIAFSSNRDGTDAIYVAGMGGSPRRIAFGEAHRYLRPHWAADGKAVYAVRSREGGNQEAVRIPVNGGAGEVLPLAGTVNDVRESTDGRWLYWGAIAGNAMQLWRAPRDDPAKAERLGLPPMSQYQLNAGYVVFAQPQLSRLTSCRLDTLACSPLPVELAEDGLYHWALGPRSLYLRVRDGGRVVVARHDLASGARMETIDVVPSGAGTSIAVSPDESTLVIAREEGPAVDLMIAR